MQAIKQELVRKIKKMSAKRADEADVVVLSKDEIDSFTREAVKKDLKGYPCYSAGYYLLLLLHTGMRCGEMITLR